MNFNKIQLKIGAFLVLIPVKIGNTLRVMHKDYQFEGEVTELNYFFTHLKTKENEIITIPNSHFFDKSFSVFQPQKENKEDIIE